jgi:predicted metal-dependent phosphoesterase TrpH
VITPNSPQIYPRDQYGALFDAHIHTYFDFHDGMITPQQLIQCTLRKHFNWVCAMAHDTARGGLKIRKLAQNVGIPCIIGIEVSTIRNHILAYGLHEWPYRRNTLDPEEAIDKLRAQDCAIFLAHPFLNPRRIEDASWDINLIQRLDIDGIEWINGSNYAFNKKTWYKLKNFPVGHRIAGTDAHHPAMFGYSFTQVATATEDPDELVAAMKKGKCKPYSSTIPLTHTIYATIIAIGKNKLFKRKFIENRWVKAIGDRPGSLVPAQIPNNKIWKKQIMTKPIRKRWHLQ